MGYTWKQTKHEGVRYREHPTRKHGIKPDQYFAIRYRVDGKRREEALGWASQGWTAAKAAQTLAKLQEAARTGEGASTLAEKREQATAKRKAQEEEKARLAREGVTLTDIWDKYLAVARANKAARTISNEEQCWRLWIAPIIGTRPIKDIAPIHLEKIKKAMADAGRAAQSARHVLALVRQIINFAKTNDLFTGDNVVAKVKMPSADARRLRFLTPEEVDQLLDALKPRSRDTHDMALISLNAGLRAGEIFSLTWADVDFANDVLTLRDTKSGKSRQVPMTTDVREMLKDRKNQATDSPLVFPNETGGRVVQVSETFNRVVAELGFNAGIEDRRQKIVFHSLRHSCASWLVQNGVPLITVGRLLGHSTTAMTERYSHLAPDHFRQAVNVLETARERSKKVVRIGKKGAAS